jgi:hypothetical protein
MKAASVTAVAAALLLSAQLSAQACLPSQTTYGWVGAQLSRTSLEQNLVGLEAGLRAGPRLTLRGEADQIRYEEPTPSRRRVQVGVVVEVTGGRLPLCLTGSGMVTKMGDLTVLAVPLGVVTAWSASLGAGSSRLTTYLEPRVSYRRASLAGFHSVSLPFSMIGGSGIGVGPMYGGIHVEWTPNDRRGWAAGIRAAFGL